MSRISVCILLVSLLAFTGACSSDSSSGSSGGTVTDTLGKVFSVSCSSTHFCTLAPQDPDLKPLSCNSNNYATDMFALVWGTQILTAHVVTVPASGSVSLNVAEPAHPIACLTDADCLPSVFASGYTCQNGLCQYISASVPMLTADVVALCQADIPWPLSCPYLTDPVFASRMVEVASLCGSTRECSKIPANCRQPTAAAPGFDASPEPSPASIDAGASAVDG
jgi:hypothetical protein